MREGVQAIVLCEDLQGWVFVRRALVTLGYDGRAIRMVPYTGGRGCGEQHVREALPEQLLAHRSAVARRRTVLVVHVDADRGTVAERQASLRLELERRQVTPPEPSEAVAVLIPRREIETWIHFFLDGPPVDEETSYAKYKDRESDARPAADAFARHVLGRTVPAGAPPSLVVALGEMQRVR